jgi:hypothetical protein
MRFGRVDRDSNPLVAVKNRACPLLSAAMSPDEEHDLRAKLEEYRLEHRALDVAIERLARDVLMDQLQLRRLKKRKLALKDFILRIEGMLIPDQPA